MNREKFLAIFGYGTILLGFISLGLMMYWLYFPYSVMDIYDTPYKVDKKTVYQGEQLTYSFRYCKYIDAPATIKREFVDGIVFQSDENESNLPVGCGTQVVTLKIPTVLPPGEYYLRIKATWEVNPIRTIKLINRTESFEVLERE